MAPEEGGGRIFKTCDSDENFLKNMPTSHAVSLDLVMYAAMILQCLFCHVLAYTITANGVCLHC